MTDPKELERLEGENETLRLAICGGEDAPGYAASLPLEAILGVLRDNYTQWRDASETASRREEQVRVLRGAIQQAVNLIVALKDGRARFLLENTLAEVDALALSSVPPQGGEGGS